MFTFPVRWLALLLVLAGLALGCANESPATTEGDSDRAATTGRRGEVVSTIYATFEPEQAPGYTMWLYRVEIPPSIALDPHSHPGRQLARVISGTLTFTAIEGTVEVGRNGSPERTETLEGPVTITLEAGDTVYENDALVHRAENKGDEPVVVMIAALLETGAERAIPEDQAA